MRSTCHCTKCYIIIDEQDAYENEAENPEHCAVPLLGEQHARLYPLIAKLVIASWQTTKHCE